MTIEDTITIDEEASISERCRSAIFTPGARNEDSYWKRWGPSLSCIADKASIRVADELVVVIEEDKRVLRRGDVSLGVLPGEVRHLVDALVEGVGKAGGPASSRGIAFVVTRSGETERQCPQQQPFWVVLRKGHCPFVTFLVQCL
jgi:hypothetical protein